MAVKRNGLGKGLDSLIPNKSSKAPSSDEKQTPNTEKAEESTGTGEILVKINEVEPNRDQPRKDFDEDSLMELADSIKQFGILQPLIVQKKKDYYEIIAGERRWRAAKLAGIKEVPIIVKEYRDDGHGKHQGQGQRFADFRPFHREKHEAHGTHRQYARP